MVINKANDEQAVDITRKADMSEQETILDRDVEILLVDDDEINRELVLCMLERKQCRVDIAENGVEALRQIQNKCYDLIFMDIQMPEMDGLEVTQRIRKMEMDEHKVFRKQSGNGSDGSSQIPIIAMTAYALNNDRLECMNVGMNDYITKPIDLAGVMSAIRKWVSSNEHASSDTTPSQDEEGVQETAPTAEDGEDLNLEILKEIVNNNDALMLRLLRLFMSDYPAHESSLKTALMEQNTGEGAAIAHKIKGQLSNVGAEKARNTVIALETAIHAEEWDAVSKLFDQLELQVARVCERAQALCNELS